jgi:hypothetical protein
VLGQGVGVKAPSQEVEDAGLERGDDAVQRGIDAEQDHADAGASVVHEPHAVDHVAGGPRVSHEQAIAAAR